MTCMNKSSSLLFLFGTGSVHTTGKSENKGRSCLASQIEVRLNRESWLSDHLLVTNLAAIFFANVKKTDADSHTGQKKADLQFPAPFGNNKLFKMSLDV